MNVRHPSNKTIAALNSQSSDPQDHDRGSQTSLDEAGAWKTSTGSPGRSLPFWKRAFDIGFASATLMFLSPLFVVIAIGLLIADGRPIFYRQRRIGRSGQPFDCLKFRSMVKDADTRLRHILDSSESCRLEWAETHKLANDPRIHWLGNILRRTSLDELPQFLNVLKGDMSIVGPRPIVRDEMLRYGRHIEHYKSVRPGVTGLWQVSGRNSLHYSARVALDVEYVSTISPMLDAKIIAKTIVIVLAGRGDH